MMEKNSERLLVYYFILTLKHFHTLWTLLGFC